MSVDDEFVFPEPPNFPSELVEQCEETRDFRPILFEWYKYVAILASQVASSRIDSPAFRSLSEVHFAVLSGMLNRCSRLMLSNVRLSTEGLHGETTRILDRCISETAIKIQWLCQKDSKGDFARFLADGLKKDFKLKDHIVANIANRGGQAVVIETRMLRSIDKTLQLSGLAESDVRNAKKLPDLAVMCRDIRLGDLFYTAIQRMGSHAVHGTWSELMQSYLVHEGSVGFRPRDHEIETKSFQYVIVPLLVVDAMYEFLRYAASDINDVLHLVDVFSRIKSELFRVQEVANEENFQEG